MNYNKTNTLGENKSLLLPTLIAIIVVLNFYFAIYQNHLLNLYYSFSLNGNDLKSILSSMILTGGITYIALAFLRGRNGKRMILMGTLPLLSLLLYRFVFGTDLPGIILPVVMMGIQAILGIVPTILWIIINRILLLLPLPAFVFTILSPLIAVVFSICTAIVLNGKTRYRKKKIIKTKRKRGIFSFFPPKLLSLFGNSGKKTFVNQNISEDPVDGEIAPVEPPASDKSIGNTVLQNTLYEKQGYSLTGRVNWSGSMENGSCSVSFDMKSRQMPELAYIISGTGYGNADSQNGTITLKLSAASVNGNDCYEVNGVIYYDQSTFARIKLQLSNETDSYSIKGEISSFSSVQSGCRQFHLIVEDQQSSNYFYAEGTYTADGLF